jgi:hypothetical protein
MLLGHRNFRYALGRTYLVDLSEAVLPGLVSFFNEFMKTFIQQFIKFQATIEGRLLEGSHELGGMRNCKGTSSADEITPR